MRLFMVSFFLVSLAISDNAVQTDWSGGCGVEGPISEWNDTFWDSDANIDYTGVALKLLPGPSSLKITIEEDFTNVNELCCEDIDGDGDIDIIGAASSDGVAWWENIDGSGTSWVEHTIDEYFLYAFSVCVKDLDGDGDIDVLGAAGWNAHDINWWENVDGTGTNWLEHQVVSSYEVFYSVYSIDLDNDGDQDIIGAAYSDGVFWYENIDGVGTAWLEHSIDGDFNGAMSVYSDDMDNDGDADVLGASRLDDNEISWWENTDGTGTAWDKHITGLNFYDARSVCSGDIDGDGDKDILAVAHALETVSWWENTDGAGTNWTEHVVDGNFLGAFSVSSSDVDGDGDEDILGAADTYSCGSIVWWENTDGTGTNLVKHTVDENCDGGRCAFAADINGDGETDIFGAANGANDVIWWDLFNFVPVGNLESSVLSAVQVSEWNTFTSNIEMPSGTSVAFQFRSAEHYNNIGAWSDTVFASSTSLEGILSDSSCYLQYRVILETTNPALTPELNEVVFSYTQQGIEESGSSSWSMNPLANPSFGLLSIQMSVPEIVLVNLFIYDVSGRVVGEFSEDLPVGTHSVNFAGLSEGVYFCTMHAGGFAATERVVVLE